MKIAIKLDTSGNIDGVNNTNDSAAESQSKIKGWVLVESNPAFSIDTKELWTVRESDNVLVHISTGMTPDEEKSHADALLGKNVGETLAKAQMADTKAENAVASAAKLGKLIAPLLATQTSSNTDDDGSNE
ncbi:hypothetical protein [Companilactobacillus farciminis]|uniref:hypothetical protein n=1 Tax=Companilactobacillus farciminis TaxID=1612 RepID=UPI00232B1B2F|nr:hypothetical protein [Companilactobacillus farciminis]WCG34740.1 hypothetical protein PML84_07645 [Companilactobacillus farciminis]